MKTIYGKEISSSNLSNKGNSFLSSSASFSTFSPFNDNLQTTSSPKKNVNPIQNESSIPISSEFGVNINGEEAFYDLLFKPPPSQVLSWEKSLLLLIPLRLGTSNVPNEYIESLKWCLRHKNSVGIMGGRPNHAIYFVGYKEKSNSLIGLDPHTVYPTISTSCKFFSFKFINSIFFHYYSNLYS